MTPIEQFIQNEIEKTIENKHLAGKAWVNQQLSNTLRNIREEYKNDMYAANYSIQTNTFSSNSRWSEKDTEELKKQINLFFQEMGEFLNRSPAGVKAKMFRILQESYKKV